MKRFFIFSFIFALFIALSTNIYAYPTGVSGATQKTSTSGCSCHSSSATTGVTVQISGPASVVAGSQQTYTVTVSGTSGSAGGVDIAASSGTLAPVSTYLKAMSGELVHSQKTAVPSTYTFTLTAPSAAGTVTLYATGKDGNFGSWNFAPNFSVNVTAPVVNNPVPATASISPASKVAGDAAFTLTVNGSNFISGSVVKFNGTNKTTSFVSATQLTAPISAADIASAGSYPVTVFTPAPGGGTSNAQTLTVSAATVNNPLPATASISPASKNAGDAAFTLTVNGSNFISSSKVRFNGTDRTTTFVSATQLTAAISAADVAAAGSYSITVFSPAPGGGTSNAQTLTVNAVTPTPTNNPVPVMASLSPSAKTAGDAAFTLTVNGSNFVSGSVVKFNGSDRPTTFVSATQLKAAIAAGDVAAAGSYPVTVFSPAPGGGTSNSLALSVTAPIPTPTTSAIALSGRMKDREDVYLKWLVNNESNISRYEVERKYSGGDYSRIITMKPTSSTSSIKTYSYKDEIDEHRITATITYRVKQVAKDGKYSYSNELVLSVSSGRTIDGRLNDDDHRSGANTSSNASMLGKTGLDQNFPNPFNPTTNIKFNLENAVNVRVTIYDITGREVATLVNEYMEAGNYSVPFDGSSLSSGTYVIRLQAGNFVSLRKMALLK